MTRWTRWTLLLRQWGHGASWLRFESSSVDFSLHGTFKGGKTCRVAFVTDVLGVCFMIWLCLNSLVKTKWPSNFYPTTIKRLSNNCQLTNSEITIWPRRYHPCICHAYRLFGFNTVIGALGLIACISRKNLQKTIAGWRMGSYHTRQSCTVLPVRHDRYNAIVWCNP